MTSLSNVQCQCVNCPGADCLCGCQTDRAPQTAPAAALACECGPRCGCDAAEQGCLCNRARS